MAGVGVTVLADSTPPAGRVEVRLLGVNDFHGHLDPSEVEGRPAGGAEYLGAHLDRSAAERPAATIRVHAGDMVGASPFVSSHFKDEPTIEALNLMRFDVGTVGNHEFDEGAAEMLRLIGMADFPYIAANTLDAQTNDLVLPPYRVVERQGARIGFIGVTTPSTPVFLLRRYAREYRWLDLSDTVNRYVPELQRQGVQAIVVLAHAGGFEGQGGEIVGEARQMSDAVDVVVAGHTHSHLNMRVEDKLIVEAWSYGTAFDEIDLTIDRASGEVVAKSALTPRTWNDQVRPEPRLRALVDSYRRRAAPLGDLVDGRARTTLENEPEGLGRIVAEGQRRYAGADCALVNRGSIRDKLPAGPLTYADLHQVHAYEHRLVRTDVSGADLLGYLERNLYTACPAEIDPGRPYTVVANELVVGAKGFEALRRGGRRATLGTDLQALRREIRRRRVVG